MPSSPPEPVYIFQQSKGRAVSAVNFVRLFDKNYLLSCSVEFCQLFDLETMKSVLKIPLFMGAESFSTDTKGRSVLTCGQWSKNRGVWANVRCGGLKFFLLETTQNHVRVEKDFLIQNPNFVGFCGATVTARRESYVACVPYEEEIKIFQVDEDGFSVISTLDSMAKSKGMPMCLKSHYVDSMNKLLLLIGYENGDLRLYQFNIDQPQSIGIEQSEKFHNQPVTDIDYFTTDNAAEYLIKGYCVFVDNRLSTFVVDQNFRLIDFSSNSPNNCLPHSGCNTVRVRKDGKFFIVGFWNGKVYAYSTKSYKLLCILPYGDITCASFADPGVCYGLNPYLACGSKNSDICTWNLYC